MDTRFRVLFKSYRPYPSPLRDDVDVGYGKCDMISAPLLHY